MIAFLECIDIDFIIIFLFATKFLLTDIKINDTVYILNSLTTKLAGI